MAGDQPISIKDFGASFMGFLNQAAAQAPAEEPIFVRLLRTHFGAEPAGLPIVAEAFEVFEHPNLHLAIEAFLATEGRSAELLGIIGGLPYLDNNLSQLISPIPPGLMGQAASTQGPVQYMNIKVEEDQVLTCVRHGLYLVRDREGPLAVLLRGPSDLHPSRQIHLDVMATKRASAERFLADLRVSIRKRSVYRGHVLSLNLDVYGVTQVNFHKLPGIVRENIILPQGLLDRVERQTLHFARHSQKLRDTGRHLKRGILLHGAPGTGKTLTAMYLAGQMRDKTVLILTGRGMNLIQQSCAMARILQPSIVILEDVDLVAEERTRPGAACTGLLFELLNEMDGLADDSDVLFLLTTNRPDILEPALASRPGRIDQAIEVPLPDADCRRRIFEFYGRGLTFEVHEFDRFVERTKGVSAAFIRELIRKAALFAADENSEIIVKDHHIEEALHELVVEGGELTKSILGVRPTAPTATS